ncbi:MAG TPA: beta galactosidase jelly roll domain-containing protein, partial [Pyrinomonadaceae bacterium]
MSQAFAGAETSGTTADNAKLFLRDGWGIQSSAKVAERGDVLSAAGYQAKGWYPARVPSTVVGTLVENKVLPDPYFGMNLRSFPGCTYPIGANFSKLEMPQDSPYRASWWYRTEFRLPAGYRGQSVRLHFDGINFRANVWLNGRQVADANDVAGTFRLFELDITETARPNEVNTLAVEVFAPKSDDLAWTWVDWNPSPPDKDMGLFRDVYVTAGGPVTVRFPHVITKLDVPSLDAARLTVSAEVSNTAAREVSGTLRGRIEGARFSQPVKLAPRETKTVAFTPEQFRQLNVKRPRLWWPVHMGEPNLYDLELEFETGGRISDRQATRFGIREVTSELDAQSHRLFKVNGRKVLIRGGGWAGDMLMRVTPERVETEMKYVRDMNLNAVRLEGKLEPDFFFDLADRYGILVMAGWCCCDHWEHWQHRPDYKEGPTWDKEDYRIAAASLADQIRRLRNHP